MCASWLNCCGVSALTIHAVASTPDSVPWRAVGKLQAASTNLRVLCTGTLIDPSRAFTIRAPNTTFCQRQLAGRCIDRRLYVLRGRTHSAAAVELQRDLNRCLTRAGCDHHMKTGTTVAAFA